MSESSNTGVAIVTVLYAMTMLMSLLGNSFLIYIVWKEPGTQSLTSFMFVNMAVADLLVTVLMMPVNVNEMNNEFNWAIHGTFGDITCRTIQYIAKVTIVASILSLTVMAIDRFYLVNFPLESRIAWFRKSKYISPLIWILSMGLMSIMPVIYYFHAKKSECVVTHLGDASVTFRSVFLYLFLITYFLPLVAISILYGITSYKIWFRRPPTEILTAVQQKRDTINKKNVVRMLVIIVVVFCLCWLPAQLLNIFYAVTVLSVPAPVPDIVLYLVIWLGNANSAINPWLYICLSSKVKRAFLQMLGITTRERKKKRATKTKKLSEDPSIPLD